MNGICLMAGCTLWGACAFAGVSIRPGSVVMTQDSFRSVQISYELEGGPAIITCDIQTNGVSIGDANLHWFSGDVNRKVESGVRTITWNARKSWPNHDVSEATVKAVVKAWAPNMPPDYMVIDLSSGAVRYYPSEAALPGGVATGLVYKTDQLLLRKCPAANVEWRMGTVPCEFRGNSSSPCDGEPHAVTLNEDFYFSVFPVTQKQYNRMIGTYPSFYAEDDRDLHPLEQVGMNTLRGSKQWPADGHAVGSTGFFYELRRRAGGGEFDLPTEAQWEFAARAGCGEELYNGTKNTNWQTSDTLKALGPHKLGHTDAVGRYEPNAWGIYDLLASVMQYCLDYYIADNTNVDPNVGPLATDAGVDTGKRVLRGGSYQHDAFQCRVCARHSDGVGGWRNTGFRVVCSVEHLP